MSNNMNKILKLWSHYVEATISEAKLTTKEQTAKDQLRRKLALMTDDALNALKSPGKEELDRISKGIFEESEMIDEGDQCNFNKMHDEEGKFSSTRRPGSWSALTRACKDRGQHKRAAGSAQKGSSSAPCGRKDRSRLCKTGNEIKNEGIISTKSTEEIPTKTKRYMSIRTLKKILASVMKSEFKNHYQYVTKNQPKTACTWNQFLKQQNLLQMAQKGDLQGNSKK